MTDSQPTFTIGIEADYLLVHGETCDLAVHPSAELITDCKAGLSDQVSPEFFRHQVEVSTLLAHTAHPHAAARPWVSP